MFQHRTGAEPETGSVAAHSEEQNSRACVQIDPCETNSIRVSRAGVPGSSTAQGSYRYAQAVSQTQQGGVGSGRTSEKASCMQ